MKTLTSSILFLTLLGAGNAVAAENCTIKLSGNDAMQFDKKEATVSASCAKVTIELAHSGKMADTVMGHNVVITKTADVSDVSKAGMKAGAAANYVPADARVLGSTKVIGGGKSTSATFAGSKLKAGESYTFFCSFPGHSSIMKGTLMVTK